MRAIAREVVPGERGEVGVDVALVVAEDGGGQAGPGRGQAQRAAHVVPGDLLALKGVE